MRFWANNRRASYLLAAAASIPTAAGSQSEPQSPRIAAVARAIAHGDRGPLADFWARVTRDGAPLIEPDLAGDPKRRLVTFVYRADSTTRNVLLFRGPN